MTETTNQPATGASSTKPVTLNQPSGRDIVRGLLPNIVINGVLPIVLTNVLLARGVAAVPALVAGAIFPLLDATVSMIRTRKVGFLSAISLVFIIVSAVSSLLSGDARFTLAKNSFFTGLFGLIFLSTLVVGKPIMYRMGEQFATGGVPEKVAYWESLWQYEGFRQTQRVMTAVWGIGFVVEAVLRIVLVYLTALPINVLQVLAEVLSYVAIGLLVCWTIAYGKRASKRGAERQAAQAAQAATAHPSSQA